jgi:hypothetical protein
MAPATSVNQRLRESARRIDKRPTETWIGVRAKPRASEAAGMLDSGLEDQSQNADHDEKTDQEDYADRSPEKFQHKALLRAFTQQQESMQVRRPLLLTRTSGERRAFPYVDAAPDEIERQNQNPPKNKKRRSD